MTAVMGFSEAINRRVRLGTWEDQKVSTYRLVLERSTPATGRTPPTSPSTSSTRPRSAGTCTGSGSPTWRVSAR